MNDNDDPREGPTEAETATVRHWKDDRGDMVTQVGSERIKVEKGGMDLALQEFAGREVAIVALRQKYGAVQRLPATDKAGYEARRVAVAECRKLWVAVEARRKELKAESLAWGKAVDGVAKQLDAAAHAIADPLKLEMDDVDKAEERAKQAAAEAERLRIEAEAKAARDAEAARVKAEQDAAAEVLRQQRAELEAERLKLAEEKAKRDAEKAKEQAEFHAREKARQDELAAQRAELDKQRKAELESLRQQEEDNRRLEAARQKAVDDQRAELDRQRRELLAEQERTRKAAQDKIDEANRVETARLKKIADDLAEQERQRKSQLAKEQREAEQAAAAKAEAERQAALAPDKDKLTAFAAAIRAVRQPGLDSLEAIAVRDKAVSMLNRIADGLEGWKP